MCGICCRLREIENDVDTSPIGVVCCMINIYQMVKMNRNEFCCMLFQIEDLTKTLLTNRGKNAHNELTLQTDEFNIHFSGFVLWQQGAKICIQPHSYKHHIVLINGDIFTKRDDSLISDTEWLAQRIDECDDEIELLELFRSIEGPYSIIYCNQSSNKLYFLRDILGRQSLLLAKSPEGDTILSSVLGKYLYFSSGIHLFK